MMELNPTVGFRAPEAAEISPERLKYLLRKIEAELYCSEVYNIALVSLQKLLGQAATKAEIVIRAVGREAIQLALKQMARQQPIFTPTLISAETSQNPETSSAPSKRPKATDCKTQSSPIQTISSETQAQSAVVEASVISPMGFVNGTSESVASSSHSVSSSAVPYTENSRSTSPASVPPSQSTPTPESLKAKSKPKQKKKKLTPAEIAAQAVKQREMSLRQIGEEIRQARESFSVSLQQMHYITLIPVSHIEAIENGKMDQLPEDIYLRGFIYRLAHALGLDGAMLTASLPEPDRKQQFVPSWTKLEPDSGFYLNSVHLYMGYAALLAGSVGGIAWLSQQSTPEPLLTPTLPNSPSETTPHLDSHLDVLPTPGLETDATRITIGADLSPPEVIWAELSATGTA